MSYIIKKQARFLCFFCEQPVTVPEVKADIFRWHSWQIVIICELMVGSEDLCWKDALVTTGFGHEREKTETEVDDSCQDVSVSMITLLYDLVVSAEIFLTCSLFGVSAHANPRPKKMDVF